MDLNLGKETSYFFSNSIPPRVIFSYILADQRVLHTIMWINQIRKSKVFAMISPFNYYKVL